MTIHAQHHTKPASGIGFPTMTRPLVAASLLRAAIGRLHPEARNNGLSRPT